MERLEEVKKIELLNKSKSADKVKSYGTTRYERRNYQRIINDASVFNKIDMNALFKADLLSIKVPVKGETDEYEVEFLLEGICEHIKKEIKKNRNKLEYKCVYIAVLNTINSEDVLVSCTCPDWKYRMSYYATRGKYNAGKIQLTPSDITNPKDSKGAGCKHVLAALSNLNWAIMLASTIYNYIVYMEQHYKDKYSRLIYPKIYDKGSYEPYKTDELANSMDNEQDRKFINKIAKRGEEDSDEFPRLYRRN